MKKKNCGFLLKKQVALLLVLMSIMLYTFAGAERNTKRVYYKGEVPDIPKDEILLELYVAPTIGSDGMLMISGGKTMVVDGCSSGQYERLRDIIEEKGFKHINIAFNTHPHSDHLNGMIDLFQDYPVDVFMTAFPEPEIEGTIQLKALNVIRKAGTPIQIVKDGDKINFGNAELTVMRQTKYGDNLNQLSAMLMVKAGECRILLTADVEGSAQRYFVQQGYDLRADIMKCPHHGIGRIEKTFLDAVSPEAVFITHGYDNCEDGRASLEEHNIPYGISSFGTIRMVTNGKYWIIDHKIAEDKEWHMKNSHASF